MTQNDSKTVALLLAKAKSASEVTELLKNNQFFKNSAWWPYGDTESNFSTISSQSKDSINALVEKNNKFH